MSDELRDITIIGAGPVGLCTAFWAGMRQASAQIVDSLPRSSWTRSRKSPGSSVSKATTNSWSSRPNE